VKPSGRASIPSQVLTRMVGDELVVLNLSTGTYYGLDPIGAKIWENIVEGKSLGEICAQLLQEYDVPVAELESDILQLTGDLAANGLMILDVE